MDKYSIRQQRINREYNLRMHSLENEANEKQKTIQNVASILENGYKLIDTIGTNLSADKASEWTDNFNLALDASINSGELFTDNGNLIAYDSESMINAYEDFKKNYISENPISDNPWTKKAIEDSLARRKENDLTRISSSLIRKQQELRDNNITTYASELPQSYVTNTDQYKEDILINNGVSYENLSDAEKALFDSSPDDMTSAWLLSLSVKARKLGYQEYEIKNFTDKYKPIFQEYEFTQDISSSFDTYVVRGNESSESFMKMVSDMLDSTDVPIFNRTLTKQERGYYLQLAQETIKPLLEKGKTDAIGILLDAEDAMLQMMDADPTYYVTTKDFNSYIANVDKDGKFNINLLAPQDTKNIRTMLKWNDAIKSVEALYPEMESIFSSDEPDSQKHGKIFELLNEVEIPDKSTVATMVNSTIFRGSWENLSSMAVIPSIIRNKDGELEVQITAPQFGMDKDHYSILQAAYDNYIDTGSINSTLRSAIGTFDSRSDELRAIESLGITLNDTRQSLIDSGNYDSAYLSNEVEIRKATMSQIDKETAEEMLDFCMMAEVLEHPDQSPKSGVLAYSKILIDTYANHEDVDSYLEEMNLDVGFASNASTIINQMMDENGNFDMAVVEDRLRLAGFGKNIDNGDLTRVVDDIANISYMTSGYISPNLDANYDSEYSNISRFNEIIATYHELQENYKDVILSDGNTFESHIRKNKELIANAIEAESNGFAYYTQEDDPDAYNTAKNYLADMFVRISKTNNPTELRKLRIEAGEMKSSLTQDDYDELIGYFNDTYIKSFSDNGIDVIKLMNDRGVKSNSLTEYYILNEIKTNDFRYDTTLSLQTNTDRVVKFIDKAITDAAVTDFYTQSNNKTEMIYKLSERVGINSLIDDITSMETISKSANRLFGGYAQYGDWSSGINYVIGDMMMDSENRLIFQEYVFDEDHDAKRADWNDEDYIMKYLGRLSGTPVEYEKNNKEEFRESLSSTVENMNQSDVELLIGTVESIVAIKNVIDGINKTSTELRSRLSDYNADKGYFIDSNGNRYKPIINADGNLIGMEAMAKGDSEWVDITSITYGNDQLTMTYGEMSDILMATGQTYETMDFSDEVKRRNPAIKYAEEKLGWGDFSISLNKDRYGFVGTFNRKGRPGYEWR